MLYVIHSKQPDKCIDFYTSILGLKSKGFRKPKTKTAKTTPAQDGIVSVSQTECVDTCTTYMFGLTHTHIVPIKPYVEKKRNSGHEDAKPPPDDAEKTASLTIHDDIYFMTRLPLNIIYERLNAESASKSHYPLKHLKGSDNGIRILQLRDPDGNRLNLIELA